MNTYLSYLTNLLRLTKTIINIPSEMEPSNTTENIRYFKLPFIDKFFKFTQNRLQKLTKPFCKWSTSIKSVFDTLKLGSYFFQDKVPYDLSSNVLAVRWRKLNFLLYRQSRVLSRVGDGKSQGRFSRIMVISGWVNAPTKHWAFSEKTHIWKIRNFWNEITENLFFYFQRSVLLIFVKVWTPPLHFNFVW